MLTLSSHQLHKRTFLLGNDGGFVLYLPAEINERDRTLMPSKWFGASGFGRQYLAALRVWVVLEGERVALNRANQTGLIVELEKAVRTFVVNGIAVRQTLFVPNGIEAVVMSVEADRELRTIAEPQFDMRYYQKFNTDFSQYAAAIAGSQNGDVLMVSNHVDGPTPTLPRLDFFAGFQSARGELQVELLPEADRLRRKTYLVDEHRERLISAAYGETHEQSPDEAPIWNQYSTTVYAPARVSAAPMELVLGFGPSEQDAREATREACCSLPDLHSRKRTEAQERLTRAHFATGVEDIDRAYATVLTCFNAGLVARNVTVHDGPGRFEESLNAIFAGNKYFLDAWKRDENISLGALLVTGDFVTVRAILDDTWQSQDERTGRLPQIIRLGEPLVYYSSDATLWALRRLFQYTRMSGDETLLAAKYGMVERFFTASLDFVQRGLLPSGGIIDKSYLWETWEDTAYTPRDGYPVEIELLWLTALRNYLPIIEKRGAGRPLGVASPLAARLRATMAEGLQTFQLFHLDGYLADSLSYQWEPRRLLTPNGHMAFDLDVALPAELARNMVSLGREQLAGQAGIRSLAPRDWPEVLSPDFMADPGNFHHGNMASVGIYNYHRGIEWLWLNQFFIRGELQYGDARQAFDLYVRGLVHETLHQSGIGGLSELYDARGPLGADFQAWSMAGFIAGLHAFAGIEVDAIARRVTIKAWIPPAWPSVECRRRVGQTRFDVRYAFPAAGPQELHIHPIDPLPEGYVLRLGFRSTGADRARAVVNGRETEFQTEADSRDAIPRAWMDVPWTGQVDATFHQ